MTSTALMPFSEQTKYCVEHTEQRAKRRRVKQVASLLVVVVTTVTCIILSIPSVTPASKPKHVTSISSSYIDPETILPEEREVLSDTRTSFVPSESIALSSRAEANKDQLTLLNYLADHIADNEFYSYDSSISLASRIKRNVVRENLTSSFRNVLPPSSEENVSEDATNITNSENTSDYDEEELNLNAEQDLTFDSEAIDESNFHPFWKGDSDSDTIRKTQSEIMQQNMDVAVDPCVDFYQYACGNWAALNPIPADKAGFDTFEKVRENLDFILKDLLELNLCAKNISRENNTLKMNENDTDAFLSENNFTTAELKAIYLYESCMNDEILDELGSKPLLDLLKSLGGWPVIDPDWNETSSDWLELMAQLRLYNNDILVSEWVAPDIKNSDVYIIQLDETSLGLPTRDYFLQKNNSAYLEAYKDFMIKISIMLGADGEMARTSAEEVIAFETKLAKITTPPARRNVTELYQSFTVSELSNLVPEINWEKYLTIVSNRTISLNETVVVFALKYMQDLVQLIENTQPRVVINYLLWRFIRHRVNNLDDRFQDEKQKFFQIIFGREQAPPRWKNCVGHVNSNMGMAVGAMFVKKYFQENSKNDAYMMTREIQHSFRELLNINSWIDDETKNLAKDKVDEIMLKIGFPSFILNEADLNDNFKYVNVNPKTYFDNTLSLLKEMARKEHSLVGQMVNKTIWNTAPTIVNAYYSRNRNQIMLPAAILQPPFYHRHFPRSLNYGGIGVVIGHELTHGFDDKGRLFDKHGNLNRWWQDMAFEMFYTKAQCLIDQYGLYTMSEVSMPLDGFNTQGENIADNGGIKQAFRAYTQWLSKNSDENETLPGLNVTNAQLFFLNFAQIWCGTMRPEAMKNKLRTGTHSPGKFRVIGTLSNSEDFAKAYNCPVGSPMNPVKKCSVW